MPREVISTPHAPEYASYSQAVRAGNTIYVAGTVGVDVATSELAEPTVTEQTRQSLLNCQAILRAGGAELSDTVMVHTCCCAPRTQTRSSRSSKSSSPRSGPRAAWPSWASTAQGSWCVDRPDSRH